MIHKRLYPPVPCKLRSAVLLATWLCLPACSQHENDDRSNARRLITEVGCGSCHVIAGIDSADSRVGPSLNDYEKRSYIAGLVPNNEDNLVQFLMAPQSIHASTAMPDLGLSQDQARVISRYIYGADKGGL